MTTERTALRGRQSKTRGRNNSTTNSSVPSNSSQGYATSAGRLPASAGVDFTTEVIEVRPDSWDEWRLFDHNRKINEQRAKKIAASWSMALSVQKPAVLYRTVGKLMIIDGQHRFWGLCHATGPHFIVAQVHTRIPGDFKTVGQWVAGINDRQVSFKWHDWAKARSSESPWPAVMDLPYNTRGELTYSSIMGGFVSNGSGNRERKKTIWLAPTDKQLSTIPDFVAWWKPLTLSVTKQQRVRLTCREAIAAASFIYSENRGRRESMGRRLLTACQADIIMPHPNETSSLWTPALCRAFNYRGRSHLATYRGVVYRQNETGS